MLPEKLAVNNGKTEKNYCTSTTFQYVKRKYNTQQERKEK